MGILLRQETTKKILFLNKGAEEAVSPFLTKNSSPWLDEEVADLAAEGLRTLVFASKELSEAELKNFQKDVQKSLSKSLESRAASFGKKEVEQSAAVHLEHGQHLLGVTGVEDKLRRDVKHTIEQLHQAVIKVWMLTGDKAETAICVGKATGMINRNTEIVWLDKTASDMKEEIGGVMAVSSGVGGHKVLIVDGFTLGRCLQADEDTFIELAKKMSGVIICRSSPTQKAQIARLLKKDSSKRVCAVGDGGNDVGMISVADVGIGIEGREGKSAALSADVATDDFYSLARLFFWHGRNSYLRSAALAHLIFHRGVIVAVMQGIYSALIGFAPKPLFSGWLIIGYTTVYTSLPVFSLVLDNDLSEKDVMLFPQFYAHLQRDGTFSIKVFLSWLFWSAYQGAVIMLVTYGLYKGNLDFNATTVAFTALIFSELLNISFSIKTWKWPIVVSLLVSVVIYVVSVLVLTNIFDEKFVHSEMFVLKSMLAITCSCLPVIVWKTVSRKIYPPVHQKLSFED